MPDVRGGAVLAHAGTRDVDAYVIERDGTRVACLLGNVVDHPNLPFTAWGPLTASTEVALHPAVPGSKTDATSFGYVSGAGLAPRDAAVLEISVRGQDAVTVPVVDGAYAFVVPLSAVADLAVVRHRLLDADGGQLYDSGWPTSAPTCTPAPGDSGC